MMSAYLKPDGSIAKEASTPILGAKKEALEYTQRPFSSHKNLCRAEKQKSQPQTGWLLRGSKSLQNGKTT
jgi:hypothetical protein